MARIRTIKPKFWDDVKLSRVCRDARLTFIAMWNFSDDNGVVIAESIWLKSKIYPYDQIQLSQFEKWLTELQQSGFISLFSFNNEKFYYLPNFNKHQVIDRPNLKELLVPKDRLEAALNQFGDDSTNNLRTIDDESLQERKGKEGKGKEEERKVKTATPDDAILIFPFESEDFKKIWEAWKIYKSEQHRFKYKSVSTEQAALNELTKLCNGIEKVAIEIILQSIANGWKGLFELKNNHSNGSITKGGANLSDYQIELARKMGIDTGNGR